MIFPKNIKEELKKEKEYIYSSFSNKSDISLSATKDSSIRIEPYHKISTEIEISLDALFKTVFGRTLKKNNEQWARPNWIGYILQQDKVVSMCYVVESQILLDNELIEVSGLGGVATLPEYRKLGLAGKLIGQVNNFIFEDLQVDCGLLICKKFLIPFYKKLNWYAVNCPVYYQKKNNTILRKGATMLLSNKRYYNPQTINIVGKLW